MSQLLEIRLAWALRDEATRLWNLGRAVENSEPERAEALFGQAKSTARDCNDLCEKHADKPSIYKHKQLSAGLTEKLRRMTKATKCPNPTP